MPPPPPTRKHSDNRTALLLMVFAMFSLSLGDVLVRLVGAVMPVGQLIAVRGVLMIAMLVAVMHWQGIPISRRQLTNPWSLLRGLAETVATFCFFTAIQLLPLAVATTIVFIYPVLLTLASIPLFGERAHPLRLIAVAIGFGGVVVVALANQGLGNQPGMQLAMLFPLMVAFCLVGRDLVTRKIDTEISPISVILTTSVISTLGGFAGLTWETWIGVTLVHWVLLALTAVTVVASFITYVMAIRRGEMASIAPAQYLLIVWASMWGFLIWGEVPSGGGLAGAGLIVLAGMLILWHERGKPASPAPPALPLE